METPPLWRENIFHEQFISPQCVLNIRVVGFSASDGFHQFRSSRLGIHGQGRVTRAGERWNLALERGALEPFLSAYALMPIDEKNARELEKTYFSAPCGKLVGRVNGAHCLATADKR